ncbi:hypothetical protein IFR05_006422 [Cadophora sp. M221]|nr:hypothetical protein IFR05_006422 [Cadophora sp. M221]
MGISGLYEIINVSANTVIDLYNPPGLVVNGHTRTSVAGKTPNMNQIWTIAEVGDGAIVFINYGTGVYLTAPNNLTQSANPPTTIEARSVGTLNRPTDSFESVAYPAKILDLTDGNAANGTPIIVWSKGIQNNQRWTLRPVTV